ncbi:Neurensin-1 [Chamberlinius hualienensis]
MAAAGHERGPRGKRSSSSTGSTSVCVKRVTFSPATSPLAHPSDSCTRSMISIGHSPGMRHKSSSTSSSSSVAQSPPVELKRKRKPRFGKNTDGASSRPLLEKPIKRKSKRVWPAAATRNVVAEEHDGGHQLPPECPDYYGVKSYLHHFYENVAVKNPDLYEELQGGNITSAGATRTGYRYLMEPPKKLKCRSLWWKMAVWSGVFILIAGVIVILVGYLLPRRLVVLDGFSSDSNDEWRVVDKAALRYNAKLDTCKLTGLIVFCIGGAVVAVALLIPSFFYNYCDEDWHGGQTIEPPIKVRTDSLDDDDEECDDDEDEDDPLPPAVLSPTEKKVPVTEELMKIQPVWGEVEKSGSSVGSKEALITTESLPPPKLIR